MNLAQYLHELLLENETVIIPGFGAFISNYKPAEIDNETNKIVPPSKEINFNSKIRNNDGLLVGYVAETESVSHFDALKLIEKERENIIYQLDKGEKITVENVGSLFRDAENEVHFEADIQENLLLDSFGLEAVSFEKMWETDEKVADETNDKQETKEKSEQQAIVESEEPVADGIPQYEKDGEAEKEAESNVIEDKENREEKEVDVPVEEENSEDPGEEADGNSISEDEILEEENSEAASFEEEKSDNVENAETNQQEEIKETKVEESDPVTEDEKKEEQAVLVTDSGDNIEPVLEEKVEEKRKKRGWIWFLLIFIPLILAGVYLAKDEFFPPESNVPAMPKNSASDVSQPKEDIPVMDSLGESSEQSLLSDSVVQITEENISTDTVVQEKNRFYLVGGSFKEQENVKKFMEQFDADGYEPFLLGKRGNFFIVALGSYSTEEQAILAKDTFAERNPDSGIWIFEDKSE